MKSRRYLAIRIAISLCAIIILFWLMRGKMAGIFVTLKQVQIWLFMLSFLILLSTVAIISFRLKKVFMVQGINFSLNELIRLTFIGFFFNNFLPTSVGGDVVKAYYASKATEKKFESFTSVFVDRVIGFFSFVLIASIALIFVGGSIKNSACKWAILLMLCGAIIFVILILNKAVAKRFAKLRKLYSAINSYKNHKKIVWQALCLSMASQSVSIFGIYFLARSLLISAPLKNFFLFMPIVFAVSMFPSLNGLGIREGAYVYFFRSIIQPEEAFALSLLYLVSLLGLGIIGGIVYMWGQTLSPCYLGTGSDPTTERRRDL